MLEIQTIMLFSAASLALAVTPGPDMILVAARSAAQGRMGAIVLDTAAGVTSGMRRLRAAGSNSNPIVDKVAQKAADGIKGDLAAIDRALALCGYQDDPKGIAPRGKYKQLFAGNGVRVDGKVCNLSHTHPLNAGVGQWVASPSRVVFCAL